MGLEAAGMEIVWQVEYDEQAQSVLRYHWPNVDLHKDVRDVVGVYMENGRGRTHDARDTGVTDAGDRNDPTSSSMASNNGGDGDGCRTNAGGTSGRVPAAGYRLGRPGRGGEYDSASENGDGRARANQLVPVDLICGGFPCQDLSVAGRRSGLAGERSGLFYEFMRLVDELAPRWVLIENVPGLLSSNGGRDMGAVLGTLGELGFGHAYRICDTQYWGPPQRRQRVFIVGRAGGFCPPEVLLEPEGLPWNPAPSRDAREGSARGVEGGAGAVGCLSGQNLINFGDQSCALDTGLAHHNRGPIAFDTTQVTSKANRTRIEPGRECHTLSKDGHPPSVAFHPRQDPISGPTAGCEAKGPWAVSAPAPRRLTPRECERLQGWPDDWTRYGRTLDGEVIELADTPRYRMCGNGVSAPVAEWIARRILAADGPQP